MAAHTYAFGDLALCFESDDIEWGRLLSVRYPRFALDDDADVPASFTIRFEPTGPCPITLVSPLQASLENVTTRTTATGFELVTPTTQATVHLNARRAILRGPSAMYPLDNLLRHLLPTLWDRGALFHGAALAAEGRGFLACGPSGAGKSSLAKLAGEHALSDELSGVRCDDEAAHHRLVSLPFWASRPGAARLHALLLLEHAADHRLTPLSAGEALRSLSTQLLWPTARPPSMERAFAHLADLVSSVPAFRFGFALRRDAWPFLVKELS